MDLFEFRKLSNKTILGIPCALLAHHSTDEQEAAVVRYWLLRDPLASWRRIIRQLDQWAGFPGYGHYSDIANRIRHYAEELTGIYFSLNKSSIQHHPCIVNVRD